MLHSIDLLTIETMPSWSDISLALYKEFSEKYLIKTVFRYYLESGNTLDVHFTEWSIYHSLGIQHINGKISKTQFFREIEDGLDFDSFMQSKKLKKRLNDFKHRIRMFGCVYHIMKGEKLFYVNYLLRYIRILLQDRPLRQWRVCRNLTQLDIDKHQLYKSVQLSRK